MDFLDSRGTQRSRDLRLQDGSLPRKEQEDEDPEMDWEEEIVTRPEKNPGVEPE